MLFKRTGYSMKSSFERRSRFWHNKRLFCEHNDKWFNDELTVKYSDSVNVQIVILKSVSIAPDSYKLFTIN